MGEVQNRVLIFSADGHVGAKRMADYLPYFDPDVRDIVKDLLAEEEQAYRRMLAPDFSSGPPEEPAPELDPRWAPASRTGSAAGTSAYAWNSWTARGRG